MIADVFAGGFAALKLDGSNPRDPAIARMLGVGNQTTSGVSVTPAKVMGYPAVFRAMNIIGNGVAKCRPHVMKVAKDGSKERDRRHSTSRLLRRPHPLILWSVLVKTLVSHAMGWGNGIADIERDQAGRAIGLLPLLPDRTGMGIFGRGVTVDGEIPADADIRYWTMVGGEARWLLPENVLHIKGLTFNGLWGYNVIELLKESFGAALATREFGSRFFGQGSVASGIVIMPPGLEEEAQERFITTLRAGSEGLGKSHRLMILEQGTDFKQMTIPNESSQFLQTKEFDIRDIALACGVQPHKLGDPTRKSYNSLEQSNQEHLDDDLDPWLGALEEELENKTLTEVEKESESHIIEFNRRALMRTNAAARAQYYSSGLQNGHLCINDVRSAENLNPIGPKGDVFRVQMQMIPVREADKPRDEAQAIDAEDVPEEPEDDVDAEKDEEASRLSADYQALAMHECRRFVTRICRQAVAKADDVREYLEFIDAIQQQCTEPAPLRPLLSAVGKSLAHGLNIVVPPGTTLKVALESQIEPISAAAIATAESLLSLRSEAA